MALDLSQACWLKSSHSDSGGQCVEIARIGDSAAVRDSKNPDGAPLIFAADDWRRLLKRVKDS